jgi:hypothetical protein
MLYPLSYGGRGDKRPAKTTRYQDDLGWSGGVPARWASLAERGLGSGLVEVAFTPDLSAARQVGRQVVDRRPASKTRSTVASSKTTGRRDNQAARALRATTNTASGWVFTIRLVARTGTITPPTVTRNAHARLSNRLARDASWALFRTYGTRAPLIMNVLPPTQIFAWG